MHVHTRAPSIGNRLSKLIFDPELLPIVSVAGELALPAERLSADWLRSRFAAPPEWMPETTDEHVRRKSDISPIPAAVLLPILMRSEGPTMLLTQRTAHLHDHAGQVSLPGGRVDRTDDSAIHTALRETEEEVGLDRRHVDVLGTLPDYFTGTGFRITPVVALVQPPFTLQAESFEVAEIFEVPLSFLMNGQNHQRRVVELPEGQGHRTFYTMPYGRYFIWGATAGMLRNLFHFLRV